ncbi:MAG: TrmH family RNA methyltransferase [Bacteroidetes bacterium]|jgi:tRNA G18 (ribose-2'-O)-methylase SpoU|nr:TrmH family RNA methyltransferase [Bacteroidota bacterium]
MRKLKNEELNRPSIDDYKKTPKLPVTIVLDNVRSMNNIGSIFRTADALLMEQIFLCGITAKPPHNDIRKTALGATESVHWEYYESTIQAIQHLQNLNYNVLAVEQAENSLKLGDFIPDTTQKYALVFGHEVKGVSQDVVNSCNQCLEIEQYGTKHSLNISVCAGIVMWSFFGGF